jgi:hypothetical protein
MMQAGMYSGRRPRALIPDQSITGGAAQVFAADQQPATVG